MDKVDVKLTIHPSSAEVKNKWTSTSTCPVYLPGVARDNVTFTFNTFEILYQCLLKYSTYENAT
jgi:hypothetical protein